MVKGVRFVRLVLCCLLLRFTPLFFFCMFLWAGYSNFRTHNSRTASKGESGLDSAVSDSGGVRGYSISDSEDSPAMVEVSWFKSPWDICIKFLVKIPRRSYTVNSRTPIVLHHTAALCTLCNRQSCTRFVSLSSSATKSRARCEGIRLCVCVVDCFGRRVFREMTAIAQK